MSRAHTRPAVMFDWLGWRVDDSQGRRVGTLEGIYEDERSGHPVWFLIRLGRFSTRYVLAPSANVLASTGRVWLPYVRETLERAPLLFSPPVRTTPALERQLRTHYRLGNAGGVEVAVSTRRQPA